MSGGDNDATASVSSSFNRIKSAGVKGTLGRLVGVFENQERKHRTYVYVLLVTELLEDWEDSVNIGKAPRLFTRRHRDRNGQSPLSVTSLPGFITILGFYCMSGRVLGL
ncbi:Diphosphoinositol polyphosphate phosphohydrolase 1 [Liparis tanakae]|uniref:Diphosphoinositol polyphosphate phosphohydrolase 1 n=1 Tax=Liparis tanakae TaxID=230148 RepID=A0A4Z2E685_9TELE|nr:Diphosphoinositol polyphosphate phosphohydrolase 1 [Liparis tanakae]